MTRPVGRVTNTDTDTRTANVSNVAALLKCWWHFTKEHFDKC